MHNDHQFVQGSSTARWPLIAALAALGFGLYTATAAGRDCPAGRAEVCHVGDEGPKTLCIGGGGGASHQAHGDHGCACEAIRTFYSDGDGDGYGDSGSPVQACTRPAGTAEQSGDCNDAVASVNPGATEACNSVDDDCDAQVDEGVGLGFYTDADGDGYGTGAAILACSRPVGTAAQAGDCNDRSATIYPGAAEICNSADDDCNGIVDHGLKAATFDGNDDYIRMSDNDALDMGIGDFSIQAWIKTAVPHQGRIYSKGSFHCTQGYMMRLTGDGRALGELTGNCQSVAGGTPLGDDRWHHVTTVFDRDQNLTVYVDGSFDGAGYIGGASASVTNATPPTIGSDDLDTFREPFQGLIDEVRVWNRTLTQAEIRANMCRTLTGNEAGLSGYWPLESNFNDATVNASHGTPNGNVTLVPR